MFARPVILLLAVWAWSGALWAAELGDAALRSELIKLSDSDRQIRQSAIASLTSSRDGRLASVLDPHPKHFSVNVELKDAKRWHDS